MQLPDFSTFFEALWGFGPFPWQAMLAERVARQAWPHALDLPTAAGKTACVDVAVYALAAQAHAPTAGRTAPRRIWFVVDRRIVVDEAFERAQELAERLATAESGPVAAVAQRLRAISGTDRPLALGRLRGGIYRDDGWARIPSQPAVIASTVDQIGSALLFRAYGHSHLAAPIYAGLAANDSLIILDEAHCSVPFLETLGAVERFRGPTWAEEPLATPFAFVFLSATPPRRSAQEDVFPGAERNVALDHPVLAQRLRCSKPARLVEIERTRGGGRDAFVESATKEAMRYISEGNARVAVMVNRIRTAETVAGALREETRGQAEVVLLTGRMRSYERNRLLERWRPHLRARDPQDPAVPVAVVSTQCLEVGADFSFDALVTEAASLDALRQRFGRLARLGSHKPAPATILIREEDADAEEGDPIYGRATVETWRWLGEHAVCRDDGETVIDMGVESIEEALDGVEDVAPFLKPVQEAPIVLPAHLDLLVQTAPPPHPEPDIALYLHGAREVPEARVVWRADLRPDHDEDWLETVALCPPSGGETLSVPLWRVRAWLGRGEDEGDSADLEGAEIVPEEAKERGTPADSRPFVLWRGRDRSVVERRVQKILPGDVVVLPAEYGMAGLGQSAPAEVLGGERLDLWEPARRECRRPAAVRIQRAAVAPWLGCEPLARLLEQAEAADRDRDALTDAIDALLQWRPEPEGDPGPPQWWLDTLGECRGGRVDTHPSGGVVLFARRASARGRIEEPDLFADADDFASEAEQDISLDSHATLVKQAAERLAGLCLPENLCRPIALAALWHDVGKADPRFQLLLRRGDEIALASADVPLAKSERIPVSPGTRRRIREASRLPDGFRHEMVSVDVLDSLDRGGEDDPEIDLVLHLVASHHGHARPFAPVCQDEHPPNFTVKLQDIRVELDRERRRLAPPPHRADSGVADRFWRNCRRFGWWGLAYLEAIVRLSDWDASARTQDPRDREASIR